MTNRIILSLSGVLLSTTLFAFPCFYTLAKSNCWVDYDVTVNVYDTKNNQLLKTVVVPKGKAFVREAFVCEAGQTLNYTATFTPKIWENEIGAVYNAQHYWALPVELTAKTKAWEVSVCYPDAFAEVPFPPQASGNCKCDFASIPVIPPQP